MPKRDIFRRLRMYYRIYSWKIIKGLPGKVEVSAPKIKGNITIKIKIKANYIQTKINMERICPKIINPEITIPEVLMRGSHIKYQRNNHAGYQFGQNQYNQHRHQFWEGKSFNNKQGPSISLNYSPITFDHSTSQDDVPVLAQSTRP